MTSTEPHNIDAKAKAFYPDRRLWKFAVFALLLGLAFALPESARDVARGAMADAYIQVSSFVGMTLILFYFLEKRLKVDTAHLLKRHERWQVPIAALIGALPGCGGAIIVITQYVLGRISFGSMVAVLTSTMGDAAFLLLAREPATAMLVFAISIVAGSVTGVVVDKIHGTDFLRGQLDTDWAHFRTRCGEIVSYKGAIELCWYGLLVPGIFLGVGNAVQVDTDLWFGPLAAYHPTMWLGMTGALFCFLLWAALPDTGFSMVNLMAHPACRTRVRMRDRVMFETSFVTTWVLAAFLIFELGSYWAAFDLAELFKTAAPLMPLIGVLVGFIPGCGPQIIVTTLYLNGFIPLSAQLSNAISNDGDALFPAIALAPKTAVLATAYTAIPALLVGYGYYFLME